MRHKLKARQVKRLLDFLDREEARCIEMSASSGDTGTIYTGKADAYGVIALYIRSLLDENVEE